MVSVESSAPSWARRLADDVNAEFAALQAQRLRSPVRLPSFVTADLPSAAAYPGAMIYVPNDVGGAVPAFSDGVDWRRVTDRAVVS